MAQQYILDDNRAEILKLLESHIQSGNLNFLVGSGASRPALEVAGNIEVEIDQLLKAGEIQKADLLAINFIEALESVNQDVVAGNSTAKIDETVKNYSEFLKNIDQLLFERKTQLLPRQASIFTTNYDFFFERAANDLATVLINDGFDRTVTVKAGFPFAPEKYFDRTFRSGNVYERQAEVPSLNLIKIHGSLTWTRGVSEEICYSTSDCVQLTEDEKKVPAKVRESLKKRVVILPNMRKFESTLLDRVYFDLLRLYSNAMEKENALLITFGFSFEDKHILDVTKRALRNPTAKLIIFAYSKKNAEAFSEKFEQQRNVLIISPSGENNILFGDLNKLFSEIAPLVKDGHD
ncbi:SIR2 family protein [Parasphingorhabdus sp.]|uniref:SIR2 family protein n=1 Tax=Parasphingorhabdus sp. TaxID=2709688 RepID=UPI003A940E60